MNTNVISQTMTAVAIPSLIITVFAILCQWKILSKAGKPGWFSIIPILNIISLYQIADALKFLLIQIVGSVVFSVICNIKGDMFLIGSFICLFAIIISSFALPLKLAKRFNKGALFGILLMFLPIIGYPMLAFGKSQYTGKVETLQEDDPRENTEEDDQEVPQEDNQEIPEEEGDEEDLSEFTNENYVPEEEENIDSTTEEENPEIEDLDDKEFIDPPVTIQDEEEPQVVDIDNEEDNSIEEENDAVDTIEQEEVDEDDEQQDEDSELETKEIDF